jgi:hypothetical protein
MDRNIVYPGAIPLDTDMLNINRNTMIALGALIQATFGTSAIFDGLAVVPTVPAMLAVVIEPGSITQLTTVDQSAYGSLPANTADPLMKMGVNLTSMTMALVAPTSAGQSINYLVEAAFLEIDDDPVVLPYYNAANPAMPYLGPNNSGTSQLTLRQQQVQLQLKAGLPAVTGSQTTPSVDAGWVGLAVVSVAYGQTQITSGSIAAVPSSAVLQYKLPQLRPGFSTIQAFTVSGSFVVPVGVSLAKVMVIGGGGAGGTHSTLAAGGGGAGGQAIKIVSGLTAGSVVPITVGAGGAASSSPATGGSGGTSSFGTYVSATGGSGGVGGAVLATSAGGAGGAGVGGDVNFGGSYGGDCIVLATRGGDGGGPGSGRGTTGAITAISAPGFGGGGGGGGSSTSDGTGSGAVGGYGGAGLVIVEF